MNDKIVFSLSDQSGELRFERFATVGAPELEPTVERLQAYLLGRPLRDIDVDKVADILTEMDARGRDELLSLLRHLQRACVRPQPTAASFGGSARDRTKSNEPVWRRSHASVEL